RRRGWSVAGKAAWCAVALFVLAGVAACSGDDSDDSGQAGATTTAAPDTTSTTAAPPETEGGGDESADEDGGAVDPRSEVRSVEVAETADHGEFDGVAYVRMTGSIQGVVGPDEAVAGLDGLAMDDEGLYRYSA